MRIVCLDAAPADAGDLDWSGISSLGELTVHPNTAARDVTRRLSGATVALTNKVRIDDAVMESAPDLRLICVLATGYDVVEIEAARRRGITVCNVPAYSTASTAQLAIGLLIALASRIDAHNAAVHRGEWSDAPAFTFWKHPLVELDGLTLAIVGTGAIGSRVGRIAEAMGMSVISAQLPGRPAGATGAWLRVPFSEAMAAADAVSLHAPLTADTKHLIDADVLRSMKAGAFIVNAGRGPLVDEAAMRAALDSSAIAGYASDVLSTEPPPHSHPLFGAPNCILTPHIGWATLAARKRLLATVEANIRAWVDREPQNTVS